ncbi:hypothetical protein AAMO2058_000011500 [Amorphochlora amoebiformis]
MVVKEVKKAPSPLSTTARQMMEKRQQRQKERQAMYQHQQAQITERIAKERVRKIEKQERKFDRTINQIGHTLQFVKDEIDPMLHATSNTYSRKKKELYQKWSREVYEPIYEQIDSHLRHLDAEELSKRKRKMFDKFLQTGNHKLLFRDIVLQDEYDPLAAHKYTGKYKAKNIRDPLKKSLEAAAEEAKIAKGEVSVRNGRETIDITSWGRFESTTLGRLEHKPTKSVDKNYRPGTLGQDHYEISRDPELVKSEFFPGGKKMIENNVFN